MRFALKQQGGVFRFAQAQCIGKHSLTRKGEHAQRKNVKKKLPRVIAQLTPSMGFQGLNKLGHGTEKPVATERLLHVFGVLVLLVEEKRFAVVAVGGAFKIVVNECFNPLANRQARTVDGAGPLIYLAHDLAEYHVIKLFLIAEVVVQKDSLDAGLVRNGLHTGRGVALFEKNFHRHLANPQLNIGFYGWG
ncbi:MAG: hypothetical protein WKG07_38880 [Hymenobacter sp.]